MPNEEEGEPLEFDEMEMPDEELLAAGPADEEEGALIEGEEPFGEEEGAIVEEFAAAEPDEEEEEEEPEEELSLLDKILSSSPYTVMLGMALAAILIAVVCLALELGSYSWDFGAKDYRGSALIPAAAQSGFPNTIEAA